jgi:hypothetical protein
VPAYHLIGFALLLVAFVFVVLVGPATVSANPAHHWLLTAGLVLVWVGIALCLTAWIGALIRTAQVRRWGWFVALLLVNIAMFIYILDGPDSPS